MTQENSLAIIDTVEIQQVQDTMRKITQFQQVLQKTLHQRHDFGIIPGTEKPTLLKPGAEKILMMLGLRSEFEIIESARDFEKGFFQYQVRCRLFKGEMLLTEGLGACNTRERKYLKIDPYTMDNTVLKMAKKRALVDAALLVASLSDVFTQDIEDLSLGSRQTGRQSYEGSGSGSPQAGGQSSADLDPGSRQAAGGRPGTGQAGLISKAQARRMFALAGGSAGTVQQALQQYGYAKTGQVQKEDYASICELIGALVDSGN